MGLKHLLDFGTYSGGDADPTGTIPMPFDLPLDKVLKTLPTIGIKGRQMIHDPSLTCQIPA